MKITHEQPLKKSATELDARFKMSIFNTRAALVRVSESHSNQGSLLKERNSVYLPVNETGWFPFIFSIHHPLISSWPTCNAVGFSVGKQSNE